MMSTRSSPPSLPTEIGSTSVSYAVIFRTHFWDEFTERQLARLKAVTKTGEIHILVDETNGHVAGINHPHVFRVKASDFVSQGYAEAGEGSLLWYNGDYPLFAFRDAHPGFKYYLQLEYDVVLNLNVDSMVATAAASKTDFVGLTKGPAAPDWYWLHTCIESYRLEDIRHQLICLSLFSGHALDHLKARRLEMSQAFGSGTLKSWPMCEGFIATEMHLAGLASKELSIFGDVQCYDHWPPYLEGDPRDTVHSFVHPVLDEERYVSSAFKYPISLPDFVNPLSIIHRKLSRLPFRKRLDLTFRSKLPAALVSTIRAKTGSSLPS